MTKTSASRVDTGRDWPRCSVLIADPDDRFRDLVKQHLGGAVRVVGDAGDADAAVGLARSLHPDVVLLDILLPPFGGAEAARRIKADRAETRVVLLTSGEDPPALPGRAFPCDAVLPRHKVIGEMLSQIGRSVAALRVRSARR
jgi:DNA-binding NarL/FixJ family response regulator